MDGHPSFVNKEHGRTLCEKRAYRVGIHEARKNKFSVSKTNEGYIERSVPGKDVQDSKLVDVLFDPVNFSGCTNGEETPG
jgi:hypothetical protein